MPKLPGSKYTAVSSEDFAELYEAALAIYNESGKGKTATELFRLRLGRLGMSATEIEEEIRTFQNG